MTVQITVIGLGRIGTSFGLALASQKDRIHRVGHDRDPGVSSRSEKKGAFDKTHLNIHAAVEKADAVILAVPVDEARPTLELIAPTLKSGAVVLDVVPGKSSICSWAGEVLGKDKHLVSLVPALNPAYFKEDEAGVESAHADLFQKSVIVITSPPDTNPDALKLAADLVQIVGAIPLFSDPVEADGLSAAAVLLPKLAAAALLNATIGQPGWLEGRKIAGRAFAENTVPVEMWDEYKKTGEAALVNRENAVRVIDNLVFALQDLRQALADNDAETLQKLLKNAQDGHARWIHQRSSGNFDDGAPKPEMPSTGESLRRLFWFGSSDKEKDKKTSPK